MQQELLFEIGTEEIPAGILQPALEHLINLFTRKLEELGLPHGEIRGGGTPRRLAVSVAELAEGQPDRREEILGPPKKAAVDAENHFTKAAVGFARSRGATVEDLQIVITPKGEYVMLIQEKKGRSTQDLLSELLPELVTAIPLPRSMHWGTGNIHFARPIHWLLTLFDGKVVPCRLDGITGGATTRGHRFMAPEALTVTGYEEYLRQLRERHVLVDLAERRKAVLTEITRAAAATGGQILPDEELVETVTNLVEEPHAICGTFEERFLALPREVLITSMREHQKYFAVVDAAEALLPHFVAVNNTKVKDEQVGTEGHQRVLRARLEDAFFFFKEDQARPLADRVPDLEGVIFQAKLGTLQEKTERITRLAGLLATELAPEKAEIVSRAAHLAKADLLTSMVSEFPSLQGVIGRDYALLSGENREVAEAIREHYLPLRADGELPRTLSGALVSLADRLDTIAGCFGIGETPTGTTDPFGLRRLALGLLHIVEEKDFHLSLTFMIDRALELYGDKLTEDRTITCRQALDYIKGRFSNDLATRGVLPEAVEAVTAVDFDDPVDCHRRIEALVAISARPEFSLLAGAFKRVINIIKGHREDWVDEKLLAESAEHDLFTAYQETARKAEPLLEEKNYEEALAVILEMKEPVDRFFDEVMVMVEENALRNNRLALLTAIARLFLRVGDFSKMYAVGQP
ncbi:MAG: glycine--tRNA ligase subunit beta [Deltaproteobacteria bacterium]|jgi:glycyl-tRNA synthetase beta chain